MANFIAREYTIFEDASIVIAACLLALALIFLFNWGVAATMYEIAVMKGHTQKKYFWWCFWVPAAGFLMVIALPDRGGSQSVSCTDELPDI